VAAIATGVNILPGSEDDGWAKPAPVHLADGSIVQLYKDGEALRAAYEAIRQAKRRILLEVYIFASDATGRAFADLLTAKAREGVRVFLMYDSFGCINYDRDMFRRMARNGVMVQEFNPVRPWECRHSWRPMNRDHRKLLVVDDHIGGMGGLNIADEYAGEWVAANDKADTDYWRDTSIGISGPSVRPLIRSFIAGWQYAMHGGPIRRAEYIHNLGPLPPDKRRVSQKLPRTKPPTKRHLHRDNTPLMKMDELGLLASVPTTNSLLRPLLHRLFRNAEQSIQMTMAYFAPDDELAAELCDAARRGVRVQLMLPGRSDVKLLSIAAHGFYDVLMAAGVEVFERQTVILHSKTMVVDNLRTVIGSTNLDYRSIEYNCELSIAIRSAEFGQQMSRLFANDICYAKRIHAHEWRRRPWVDRMTQWAVSRARYLL
jgi:cardiolipin synthase